MVNLSSAYNRINRTRILRAWEFEIQFYDKAGRINKAFDPIFAKATSFPGRESSDIELPIGGTTVKYPGPPSYNNSWTANIRDNVSLSVRKAFDKHMGPIAWYDKEPDFQEQMSVMIQTVSAGRSAKVMLENAYISNIGEITMDYGDESVATYDVTFNYHRWILK